MGSVVEVTDGQGSNRKIYVTGDTMLTEELGSITARYPDLDAVVIHLGGTTLPGGFIVTMTGSMGVEYLRRLRPKVAVPVHFDDYGVFRSGLDDFRRAVDSGGHDVDVRYVGRGDTVALG
jgi:L-ascorbate metabolism protein UlaG (beta-lactamase superfamily)